MAVPKTIAWFTNKKVWWRNRWFDEAMVTALTDVEREQGYNEYFYQGSYNSGVSASGGTHDRGAVYDGRSQGLENRKRKARRGIVEWPRTPAQGFSTHGHGFMLGLSTASTALKAQMYSWVAGRNGLVNNRADDSGVRSVFVPYLTWRSQVNGYSNAYIDGIEKSRKYGNKVRPYASVKLVQRAINTLYGEGTLLEDGVYGPKTTAAYDKFRTAVFNSDGKNPDWATGSVGVTGLKILFSRAGMKVYVRAKSGGPVL